MFSPATNQSYRSSAMSYHGSALSVAIRTDPAAADLGEAGGWCTVLHKPIGDRSDYAESWEISDYRDQVSIVQQGSLAGT